MSGRNLLIIITSLAISIVMLYLYYLPDDNLHVVACDVGQGDATLIIHKNTQILVDAGSGNRVLGCLGDHTPFWDKQIELAVITHPQADHYEGFVKVFESYNVDKILMTELDASSESYRVLENLIMVSGTQIINASETTQLGSDLIHLDILHPSSKYISQILGVSQSDMSDNELENNRNFDPNEASVVLKLSYGEFDALLTGDIGQEESDLVADKVRSMDGVDFEYIKVPHHGSRNGISEKLLRISDPEIATISSGESNSYGHPHKEVLELLVSFDVDYYRTDKQGDIEIVSDGEKFWVADF